MSGRNSSRGSNGRRGSSRSHSESSKKGNGTGGVGGVSGEGNNTSGTGRVRNEMKGKRREASPARATKVLPGVPVVVGQLVQCEIVGLTHDGEGVGRVEGYTLFVQGALPGEKVQAEVVSIGKSFGRSRMTELIVGSAIRQGPPCPIYDSCGGCQLQHMSYSE